jgi:hypothetical protein
MRLEMSAILGRIAAVHQNNFAISGGTRRMMRVQSFSHIWFGLSGARHWLKR